jgi:hypothetical protein
MAPTARYFETICRILKRVRLWNLAVLLYVPVSWAAIFGVCVLVRRLAGVLFR